MGDDRLRLGTAVPYLAIGILVCGFTLGVLRGVLRAARSDAVWDWVFGQYLLVERTVGGPGALAGFVAGYVGVGLAAWLVVEGLGLRRAWTAWRRATISWAVILTVYTVLIFSLTALGLFGS